MAAYLTHDYTGLTGENLHKLIPGNTSLENSAIGGLQSVNNSLDAVGKGLEESYENVLKSIGFGGDTPKIQFDTEIKTEPLQLPSPSQAHSVTMTDPALSNPPQPITRHWWNY